MNNKSILFLISSIIAGKANRELFKFSGKQDWNKLVQVASGQLVFPALFLRLSDKEYKNIVPTDLLVFAEHVYNLNYLRNRKIIEQAHEINRQLRKHNIKPVFLKGTAYLLCNLYPNIGDRMVGDIDLLVETDKIQKAAEILKTEGYQTQQPASISISYFTKHYPRLVHNEHIAAVEIHRLPVNYENTYALPAKNVIDNAQLAKKDQNILIPAYKHLLLHSFIHNQLDNKAQTYKKIDLRGIFDFYLLQKKVSGKHLFIDNRLKRRFEIYSQLVCEVTRRKCKFSIAYKVFRKQVFIALDFMIFRILQTSILFLLQLPKYYSLVLIRCVNSRSYRTAFLNKCGNPNIWKNHFRNIYLNYKKVCRI